MSSPLVTLVCLNYNHQEFVRDTLESVLSQTYQNLEVILVDDKSTDNSVQTLKEYANRYAWKTIFNKQNIGNCRSFNKALAVAKGEYIVDLACDDILYSTRIEQQVALFTTLPPKYAVLYSNAEYINEQGEKIKLHHNVNHLGKVTLPPPSGWIYPEVVKRYFICSPTVIVKTDILKEIGGYDESLLFEDWDFWVRTSRKYKFKYQDEILTKKRILKSSLSFSFWGDKSHEMHSSVLSVCQKIKSLNQNKEEDEALAERLILALKEAFYAGDFALTPDFFNLLKSVGTPPLPSRIYYILSFVRPRFIKRLYRIYRSKKAYQ